MPGQLPGPSSSVGCPTASQPALNPASVQAQGRKPSRSHPFTHAEKGRGSHQGWDPSPQEARGTTVIFWWFSTLGKPPRGPGSFPALTGLGGNPSPGWGCKPSMAPGWIIPALFARQLIPHPGSRAQRDGGTGRAIDPGHDQSERSGQQCQPCPTAPEPCQGRDPGSSIPEPCKGGDPGSSTPEPCQGEDPLPGCGHNSPPSPARQGGPRGHARPGRPVETQEENRVRGSSWHGHKPRSAPDSPSSRGHPAVPARPEVQAHPKRGEKNPKPRRLPLSHSPAIIHPSSFPKGRVALCSSPEAKQRAATALGGQGGGGCWAGAVAQGCPGEEAEGGGGSQGGEVPDSAFCFTVNREKRATERERVTPRLCPGGTR